MFTMSTGLGTSWQSDHVECINLSAPLLMHNQDPSEFLRSKCANMRAIRSLQMDHRVQNKLNTQKPLLAPRFIVDVRGERCGLWLFKGGFGGLKLVVAVVAMRLTRPDAALNIPSEQKTSHELNDVANRF